MQQTSGSASLPSQRIALVTGGAVGIGAACARWLGRAGYRVVVADKDPDGARRCAEALIADGLPAEALAIDVSDPSSVESAFSELTRRHGRCDVLVNSAGIAKVYSFLDFPLENWRATLDVNLTGTFLCAQHAARLMLPQRWGRIVNVASVAGLRAVGSGRTAYGTSKAGVIALTRQIAVELAEHGITVNAVCPGPVDTPMTQVLHSEQFRTEYAKAIPLERYGSTDEIAAVVAFLASDAASYVTGIAMPVDGGFLASGARSL